MRVWLKEAISLAVMKRAASSDPAAEDMKKFDDLVDSDECTIVGWDGYVFRDKYLGPCPVAGD